MTTKEKDQCSTALSLSQQKGCIAMKPSIDGQGQVRLRFRQRNFRGKMYGLSGTPDANSYDNSLAQNLLARSDSIRSVYRPAGP